MIERLRECFDDMAVYKDLQKSNFFASLSLPSFLRDWVLQRFEDEDGNFDFQEVSDFIHTYMPRVEEWVSIKNRVVYENERVKLLTRILVDIDVRKQEISFSLPDFGLANRETVIEPDVWDRCKDDLAHSGDVWGVVELGYRIPDEDRKIPGKIKLTGFTTFCPYTVNLDFYKESRAEFTTAEWIDILLGAIDYNAKGYDTEKQKLTMLTRLLPFIEKRLNLIELAPKGTGKSYVYGRVSRNGWLSSGGTMTRAKLFYDVGKHTRGLVCGNDLVVLDEVQTISFPNVDEMRGALKGYMENGVITVGNYEGTADAGIVLVGNIAQENMDVQKSMFLELPSVVHEAALIDRFHGFIRGWEIPRMHEALKISGWALNSEYFCTIMHMLRDDPSYRAIVEELLIPLEDHLDTRDTEAVKRICTAYLKLLFPHVRSAGDVDPYEFKHYCLDPAVDMRGIILYQLGLLDAEYRGRVIPKFAVGTAYA